MATRSSKCPLRRSLVRRIVSLIPEFIWKYIMTSPTHIYIHPCVLGKINYQRSDCLEEEHSNSFQRFSSYLHDSYKKPDLLLNSTPKKKKSTHSNGQITALQKELDLLKLQIAKIMEQNNETKKIEKPLLPPPPPPPLPTFQPLTPITITPAKPKSNLIINKPNGFGGDFLKDLDKVKLRKTEKSPGGGPIKQGKVKNEPADILQEILRKRFNVIQNTSPEGSSVSEDDSFSMAYVNITVNKTPSAAAE